MAALALVVLTGSAMFVHGRICASQAGKRLLTAGENLGLKVVTGPKGAEWDRAGEPIGARMQVLFHLYDVLRPRTSAVPR